MREKLIGFFEEHLGVDKGEISNDTPLYSSGLLDSYGMVEALMFIEELTGIRFEPEDVSLDNLDSVDMIVSFIEAQRTSQQA